MTTPNIDVTKLDISSLCFEKARSEHPCRDEQLALLIKALQPVQEPIPPVFVYGEPGTGKTCITKTALGGAMNSVFGSKVAYFDCIGAHSSRVVFESMLDQLHGHIRTSERGFAPYCPCDHFEDFLNHVDTYVKEFLSDTSATMEYNIEKAVYLVFDGAEKLRDIPGSTSLVYNLFGLGAKVRRGLGMVFISVISWEKFGICGEIMDPVCIHFPTYRKNEVLSILPLYCPENEDIKLFRQFIVILFDVFVNVCRDMNELRHITALLYPLYRKPVLEGELIQSEKTKLFKNIEPYFQRTLDRMYLRQLSVSEWDSIAVDDINARFTPHTLPHVNVADLPYYSKYLLVASYLGSYLHPKTDLQLFGTGTHGGKIRKTNKGLTSSRQLSGPKSFPVDRVIAIYRSIVAESVNQSIFLLHQAISGLVNLGILARVSTADNLDSPKYELVVGKDFVQAVANNIGFNIKQFDDQI